MNDIHFLNQPGPDVKILRTLFPPDENHKEPFYVFRANIPRQLIVFSPKGFDNKDGGGLDLALNILQHFCPGEDVAIHGSTQRCSKAAAHLYPAFFRELIVNLDYEGGVITAESIRAWLSAALEFNPGMLTEPEPPSPKHPPTGPRVVVLPRSALDDLKRLHRLATDFLYVVGHRIETGQPLPPSDPVKAIQALTELDRHLNETARAYGFLSTTKEGK